MILRPQTILKSDRKIIIRPELIPRQKVRNDVDSVKKTMDGYIFLIMLGEVKTSTSSIKAAITSVKPFAQNKKLTVSTV